MVMFAVALIVILAALVLKDLFSRIISDNLSKGHTSRRTWMRGGLGLAMVMVMTMFAAPAAHAVSGFFAWTAVGNGRGGPVASRFACSNQYRGREWALYGASASVSDIMQVCVFSTAGGGTYVFKGINTTASGT